MSQQLYRWVITINDPQLVLPGESESVRLDLLLPPCMLEETFEILDSKNWVFQLERGEETGRLHYQCSLSLKNKVTKSKLLRLLAIAWKQQFPNHPVLETLSGEGVSETSESLFNQTTVLPMQDEAASFDYSQKTDTRVKGPWSKTGFYYDGSDLPEPDAFFYGRGMSWILLNHLYLEEQVQRLEQLIGFMIP